MPVTELYLIIIISMFSVTLFSFLLVSLILFRKKIVKFLKSRRFKKSDVKFKNFCSNLVNALFKMSEDKIGALIAFECKTNLDSYINVGYKIQGEFAQELVISVFYNKKSPLHDGGIIVRDYDIVSVSSYFPMTRQLLDVSFGARHRAAVGLSERTDAIVFVVSETSGRISVAKNGVISKLSSNIDRLTDEIFKIISRERG